MADLKMNLLLCNMSYLTVAETSEAEAVRCYVSVSAGGHYVYKQIKSPRRIENVASTLTNSFNV